MVTGETHTAYSSMQFGTQLPEQVPDTDMPVHWRVVELGSALSSITNGLTITQSRDGDGYPVTRIETIANDVINANRVGYVSGLTQQDIVKFRLRPGDILLSHINSEPQIGRSVMYEGEPPLLLHGMNLLRLCAREEVLHPAYLDYLLRFYRAQGVFSGLAARAVGQASINQGKLKSLAVPLPPLPEQRAITCVLRTVQKAIQVRQRELALERERKAALMQHLFTKGARAEPTKQTEIGEMPESWRIVRLGELTTLKNGINFSSNQRGSGVLTLDVLNMYAEGPYAQTDKLYRVNVPVSQDMLLQPDDLLFVRSSLKQEGVGWPALFAGHFEPVTFCGFIIRARLVSGQVNPAYLLSFLRLPDVRARLVSKSGKVAITNINQASLSTLPIPIPTYGEQLDIATALGACDAKFATLNQETSTLEELFRALLEELMTGRLSALPLVETMGA